MGERYTDMERMRAIDIAKKRGVPYASRQTGISQSTLYKWMKSSGFSGRKTTSQQKSVKYGPAPAKTYSAKTYSISGAISMFCGVLCAIIGALIGNFIGILFCVFGVAICYIGIQYRKKAAEMNAQEKEAEEGEPQ